MTDQGKADYEGYYAAMPGSTPVPGPRVRAADRCKCGCAAYLHGNSVTGIHGPCGNCDGCGLFELAAPASASQARRHQEQPEPVGTAWRLLDEARAKLAARDDGIRALLAQVQASADATRPSRKTQIEDELAIALRKLLEGLPCARHPAVPPTSRVAPPWSPCAPTRRPRSPPAAARPSPPCAAAAAGLRRRS